MSCSAVFILDLKGKVIISRNYRGDIDMNVIDKFIPRLIDMEEEGKFIVGFLILKLVDAKTRRISRSHNTDH